MLDREINFNQMKYPESLINRFKNKINIPEDYENNCWEWLGRTHHKYGQFDLEIDDIKVVASHRFMYELYFGPIPNELIVRHNCDNCSCVNPWHLLLGTQQDNVKDMIERDRQAKGSQKPTSILTETDIIEILEGIKNKKYSSISQIAWLYSVNWKVIGDMLKGTYWTHVTKNYDLKQLKTMLVNGKSKLTKDEVLEIDRLLKLGTSINSISELFGVHSMAIRRIQHRKTHKDILT